MTARDVQPVPCLAHLALLAPIDKAATKHESGLHVLARPHGLEQADMITAAHVAAVLGALQDIYDFVVVDAVRQRFAPTPEQCRFLGDRRFGDRRLRLGRFSGRWHFWLLRRFWCGRQLYWRRLTRYQR